MKTEMMSLNYEFINKEFFIFSPKRDLAQIDVIHPIIDNDSNKCVLYINLHLSQVGICSIYYA